MPPVRLLVVSNMYPGPEAPFYGAFVASHVEALLGDPRFAVELVAIHDPRKGVWRGSWKYAGLFVGLAGSLVRFRPQVVHYHYALPTALLAPLAAAVGHPPYVVTLHGGDFYQTRGRVFGGDWLTRQVLRRATGLIAVSATLAEDVDRFLPRPHPPISVINMGVDVGRFGWQEAAPLSRLAFVGQLIRRKGVDTAIRALALARASCPDLTLTIIGDGPERQRLADLAQNLGVRELVTFQGAMEPEAVPAALANHGTLLVPSRQEPLGIVALEGMATGMIVLATQVGGLAEIVEDNRSGLLVPPDDPSAFAARLVEIQRLSPVVRDELRQAGRRTAEKNATAKKVAEVARVLLEAAVPA
jgi:glycosyltransferase involved in cell wall biosynthesis